MAYKLHMASVQKVPEEYGGRGGEKPQAPLTLPSRFLKRGTQEDDPFDYKSIAEQQHNVLSTAPTRIDFAVPVKVLWFLNNDAGAGAAVFVNVNGGNASAAALSRSLRIVNTGQWEGPIWVPGIIYMEMISNVAAGVVVAVRYGW